MSLDPPFSYALSSTKAATGIVSYVVYIGYKIDYDIIAALNCLSIVVIVVLRLSLYYGWNVRLASPLDYYFFVARYSVLIKNDNFQRDSHIGERALKKRNLDPRKILHTEWALCIKEWQWHHPAGKPHSLAGRTFLLALQVLKSESGMDDTHIPLLAKLAESASYKPGG